MLNFDAARTFTINLTHYNPRQARAYQHEPTGDALALPDPTDSYAYTNPTGFG